MSIYLICIFVILILAYFAEGNRNVLYVRGHQEYKSLPGRGAVFVIFLVLAGLYTFRWCNGTDLFNYYMDFYNSGNVSFLYVTSQRDILFSFITYFTRNFISDNFLVYNAILAVLTYAPIIVVMRKYSFNFLISVLLYVLSTAYFKPYNTVRQGIAVAIIFAAFPALIEQRKVKYILEVVIAFMFHPISALAAVILWICYSDFLSGKVKVVLTIFVVGGLALPSIWSRVISFLNLIGQSKLASDYSNSLSTSTGMNIMHVLVAAVPVVLIWLVRCTILEYSGSLENRFNCFYMNVILFYFIFVLVGLYNPIFVRISQFFELYLIIFYPKIIEAFSGNSKKLLKIVLLGAYFGYMLLVLPQGGNYVPYQFNYYSINGEILW